MINRTLTVMAAWCFFCIPAQAIPIITAAPVPTDVDIGMPIIVDVGISGLTGEIIGAYDITIGFDDSVLGFNDVIFGPFLDGPVDSFQGVIPGAVTVNVSELSLGFLSLQDGFSSFSLFSVFFDTTGPGSSSFDLTVNDLGDFFGASLESTTVAGSVTVNDVVAVPEPGTFGLFGIGLLAAAYAKRRRNVVI